MGQASHFGSRGRRIVTLGDGQKKRENCVRQIIKEDRRENECLRCLAESINPFQSPFQRPRMSVLDTILHNLFSTKYACLSGENGEIIFIAENSWFLMWELRSPFSKVLSTLPNLSYFLWSTYAPTGTYKHPYCQVTSKISYWIGYSYFHHNSIFCFSTLSLEYLLHFGKLWIVERTVISCVTIISAIPKVQRKQRMLYLQNVLLSLTLRKSQLCIVE